MTLLEVVNAVPVFASMAAKGAGINSDYVILFFFVAHLAQIAAVGFVFILTLVVKQFSVLALIGTFVGSAVIFIEAIILVFSGEFIHALGMFVLSVVVYQISKGYRYLIACQVRVERKSFSNLSNPEN